MAGAGDLVIKVTKSAYQEQIDIVEGHVNSLNQYLDRYTEAKNEVDKMVTGDHASNIKEVILEEEKKVQKSIEASRAIIDELKSIIETAETVASDITTAIEDTKKVVEAAFE